MPMISYAQNQEDIRLRHALPGNDGFYLDVGASDPIRMSVTKHFYECGWRGINVEPLPQKLADIQADRPEDINLNIGLARRATTLPFFEVPTQDCLSTFSAEAASKLRSEGMAVIERRIAVRTLAEVCEDHVRSTIDFLKIDVEGSEEEVIAGGDWRRWRPRIVIVEATLQNTREPSHRLWEPRLLEADYVFAVFDGLNRFYVRAEERHLAEPLALAPNVFDAYVPFTHMEEVLVLRKQLGDATYERDQLQKRLSALADIEHTGPLARKAARLVTSMSHQVPWLSKAVKSLLKAG